VRSGPGQGYPTLANMFAGTVVPVFGRTISNRWVQVNYQGTLGWVSSGFLEFQNGLAITSLTIDGIVAEAPAIVGKTTNDYFDTLRLMLARLDLAQPSLENVRAKWTDAALQGRAFCREYPAQPSDIGIAQPTLAAYFNILDPLQRDFNDAMFNLRQAIDLFIEVCNQPGLGNPVGQATVIGALDVVNLADRQFAYLRSRLLALIPTDGALGIDECLFQFRIRQEVLKIITFNQIIRQKFIGPLDRTFGYCIDLQIGVQYAFQTLLLKGENPNLLVVITPFDNPTSFVVTSRTNPNGPATQIAPITVPTTGRYLIIVSAQQEPTLVNAEVAFILTTIPTTGFFGTLVYDALLDVVSLNLPAVVQNATATVIPGATSTAVSASFPPTCPSTAFTCTQFFTCEEARACLALGNTSLDPDGNGVPCENICAP
ncbi:MAG: SH3 domain-containing protein, partial [Armatimonadetes bacterium]|nr:SH3 domain-containing protein [Anaerolineae bacterium]